MTAWGRTWRGVLVTFLAASLAIPVPVSSGPVSFGTARGIRSVDLSLDGGKSWLGLGSRSLPLMDGTQVRAATGGALLDLTDGSRVNVLPFTTVQLRDAGSAIEVSLLAGRLVFKLPAETRVQLRTATARLEPVRTQAMAGEVFVGADGTMGLRLSEGSLEVRELGGAHRTMLASLEPVFLPRRPAQPGPLFSTEAPASAPAGMRGVFNPRGESLGYLQPEGALVVHPGYTADLTQPFAPKLVRLAMAKVPERDRQDAVPIFDVNGGYLGYLAGPVFYAQAVGGQPIQVAQAVGGGGGDEGVPEWAYWVGGFLFAAGTGILVSCLTDNWPCEKEGKKVATPLRPVRR